MSKVPGLIRVSSEVFYCAGCGVWVIRVPEFTSFADDWQCERCGCTSLRTEPGRAYGPKSSRWPLILSDFEHYWKLSEGKPQMRDDMLVGCEYEVQA